MRHFRSFCFEWRRPLGRFRWLIGVIVTLGRSASLPYWKRSDGRSDCVMICRLSGENCQLFETYNELGKIARAEWTVTMELNFHIGDWADVAVNYTLDHFTPALDTIAAIIGFLTDGIQNLLIAIPSFLGVAILALLALWRVSWKFAIFTALALGLIIHIGLWNGTMESLSLVLASTIVAVVIRIPLGIA